MSTELKPVNEDKIPKTSKIIDDVKDKKSMGLVNGKRFSLNVTVNTKDPEGAVQDAVNSRTAYLIEVARNTAYEIPIYSKDGEFIQMKVVKYHPISSRQFDEIQDLRSELDDLDKLSRLQSNDAVRLKLKVDTDLFTQAHVKTKDKRKLYYSKLCQLFLDENYEKLNTDQRALTDILDAYEFKERTGLPYSQNESDQKQSVYK